MNIIINVIESLQGCQNLNLNSKSIADTVTGKKLQAIYLKFQHVGSEIINNIWDK